IATLSLSDALPIYDAKTLHKQLRGNLNAAPRPLHHIDQPLEDRRKHVADEKANALDDRLDNRPGHLDGGRNDRPGRLENRGNDRPDHLEEGDHDLPVGLHALQEALDEHYRNFRSEEHTSELQSRENLVCRLLLEKKKEL